VEDKPRREPWKTALGVFFVFIAALILIELLFEKQLGLEILGVIVFLGVCFAYFLFCVEIRVRKLCG